MRALCLCLASAAILCGAAEAQQRRRAQPPDARQREALTQAAGALLRQGYRFSEEGPGVTGSLGSGASWSTRMEFPSGQRTALVAVCDVGCAGLAVRLTAPSGELVARDTTSGAHAVLEFTASAVLYTLTIEMAACSGDTCRWAFRSLSLPSR